MPTTRRRWRAYETPTGRRPVSEFIDDLSDPDAAAVAAAMKDVQIEGLPAARHLRGDVYEVIANAEGSSYRILFATEGKRGQVLLALEAISKKTQKTPPQVITTAERCLRSWRSRSRR